MLYVCFEVYAFLIVEKLTLESKVACSSCVTNSLAQKTLKETQHRNIRIWDSWRVNSSSTRCTPRIVLIGRHTVITASNDQCCGNDAFPSQSSFWFDKRTFFTCSWSLSWNHQTEPSRITVCNSNSHFLAAGTENEAKQQEIACTIPPTFCQPKPALGRGHRYFLHRDKIIFPQRQHTRPAVPQLCPTHTVPPKPQRKQN